MFLILEPNKRPGDLERMRGVSPWSARRKPTTGFPAPLSPTDYRLDRDRITKPCFAEKSQVSSHWVIEAVLSLVAKAPREVGPLPEHRDDTSSSEGCSRTLA